MAGSIECALSQHRVAPRAQISLAQGHWAMFRKPQPLQLVSKKVRQYTSNLYGSTPPICIAVLSWLLSFEERETLQYASHLYCSAPPICTAIRPPFVRQYFWKTTGGRGHRNVSEALLILAIMLSLLLTFWSPFLPIPFCLDLLRQLEVFSVAPP